MQTIRLNNGVEMPRLGLGVFQIPNEETARVVADALSVGYRSIDTAQIYGNEEGVGEGIRRSGVDRKDIFITSKVWVSNFGYERAKASIDESLGKLGTDYIDLMLIHQPYGDYLGAYRALEEAYKEGKLRAIGISNFYADRYIDFVHSVEVAPAVNQVETHIWTQQRELEAEMKPYDTKLMSWGSFAEGQNDFFATPELLEIGAKHGKTAAQVALRNLLQRDIIVIPKTVSKERMAQNIAVFDFELSEEDQAKLSALDTGKSMIFDHRNPEMVKFLYSFIKS